MLASIGGAGCAVSKVSMAFAIFSLISAVVVGQDQPTFLTITFTESAPGGLVGCGADLPRCCQVAYFGGYHYTPPQAERVGRGRRSVTARRHRSHAEHDLANMDA